MDASKGFTIAKFGTIQGVYLAKKLLESVVLHGQKVVVHCNRATTARLRTEKFKYGEKEREAETRVKVEGGFGRRFWLPGVVHCLAAAGPTGGPSPGGALPSVPRFVGAAVGRGVLGAWRGRGAGR